MHLEELAKNAAAHNNKDLILDLINLLIEKPDILKFPHDNVSITIDPEQEPLVVSITRLLEENIKFTCKRINLISETLKAESGINDFINASIYLKNIYEIIFDKEYGLIWSKSNLENKMVIVDSYETILYSMVERIWTIFIKIFTSKEMEEKYCEYTHDIFNDSKMFGIYEIRFLVNNIYLYKINGSSLERTWNIFLKGDIWKWLSGLRKIRNETMHANFVDFKKIEEEINAKYSRVVCCLCILVSLVERLGNVLTNSTIGFEKFTLCEPKPNADLLSKIDSWLENKDQLKIDDSRYYFFDEFFLILKSLNRVRNEKYSRLNYKQASDALKSFSEKHKKTIRHESHNNFNYYYLVAFLVQRLKVKGKITFSSGADILKEIRMLITNIYIKNEEKNPFYIALKKNWFVAYDAILAKVLPPTPTVDNTNQSLTVKE